MGGVALLGSTELRGGELQRPIYRDVMYIQTGRTKGDQGLYDQAKSVVPEARYIRDGVNLGRDFCDVIYDRFDYVDEEPGLAFLGTIHGHYGHFITDTLARLWAHSHLPSAKWLVLNHGPIETLLAIPFIAEILSAAGIGRDRLTSYPGPTLLPSIAVPEPAFIEQTSVHPAFGQFCAEVGIALMHGLDRTATRPAYLSKGRYAGITNIINEDDLCALLEASGVEIIFPELLTVGEQARLFRDREAIAGPMGSNLHTSVFAPARAVVGLCVDPCCLSNQALLDASSGGRTIDLYPADLIERHGPAGGQRFHRLLDVRRVADRLLEAMEASAIERVSVEA